MKEIVITAAPNGWIVNEVDGPAMTPSVLAVFNRMEDLQAALPELLGEEPKKEKEAKP
jgi:hypothetical protein